MNAFEMRAVTKRFGAVTALADATVSVERCTVVGLIGRNGSGKSTLLRLAAGLYLPDDGECSTLGTPTPRLGQAELSRLGYADQHATLLEWMTGAELLRYVASFYATWDRDLERRLTEELELDTGARVGALSPGNRQRLSLILATAYRPELLLLDEPLSDLDPVSRQTVLRLLLERFDSDDVTIVISSHLLRDIEPLVNRVLCVDGGRVVAWEDLDVLYDRYAEWIVTSATGRLPARYSDAHVLEAQGDAHRARLLVRDGEAAAQAFMNDYDATIERRPMNLERIFPLLVRQSERAARGSERAVR
jgi:ABC-2 type transport system ATP-binding protein